MAQFGKEEVVKHQSVQPNTGRDGRGKSVDVPVMQRESLSYVQMLRDRGSASKPSTTVKQSLRRNW
ncbi:unnamed protein product [Camellia sinensis]